MDDVFKALADPSRRILLDALFREDGQTMTDLQAHLEMSRFGVMKHLQVLERAGLITSTKVGRERRHYLNPVPIQQVYDRWVSKYAGAWSGALTRLKYELEETPAMTEKTTHVYSIYIRSTPERLWQALTDGDLTTQYFFNGRAENFTAVGEEYGFTDPGGRVMLSGRVLEVDPPRKLVATFRPCLDHEDPPESTITFEIAPEDGQCRLTLRHEGLVVGDPLTTEVTETWTRVFSNLKTFLEVEDVVPAGAA